MSKQKQLKPKDSVAFPSGKCRVWPINQEVETIHTEPAILVTKFEDHDIYADSLSEYMYKLEKDPDWTHHMHIGGSKVRDIHRWQHPGARLLHARAMAMFAKFTESQKVVTDSAWGNITRDRDYLTAHSHTNAIASVVYFLEKGDIPDLDSLNGRFAFVDPRLSYCCPVEEQPECMVRELYLGFEPGTMMMFPSWAIHHVHPYVGDKPRITLAWNFRNY